MGCDQSFRIQKTMIQQPCWLQIQWKLMWFFCKSSSKMAAMMSLAHHLYESQQLTGLTLLLVISTAWKVQYPYLHRIPDFWFLYWVSQAQYPNEIPQKFQNWDSKWPSITHPNGCTAISQKTKMATLGTNPGKRPWQLVN